MENRNPHPSGRRRLIPSLLRVILVLVLLSLGFLFYSFWYMFRCEGEWQGETLEKRSDMNLKAITEELQSDVAYMQGLGPRNSENETAYAHLRKCEEWIIQRWQSQGYLVTRHLFSVSGKQYSNLEIQIQGRIAPSEIIIISAQYDTLPDSPGANNNASGMAVLLKLSDLLRNHRPERTLRLVAFVNEEDPFFGTEKMGSYIYAKKAFERKEDIKIMLSLDAIGIYKNAPWSQRLPFPYSLFYPDRGNFLAFIGNFPSRKYVKEATRGFKKGSSFPIEAGVVPEWAEGAAWSDHSSFWKFGYPGIMVTDTGGFRSTSHTTREDTMEKIDFDALPHIVVGMCSAIIDLTRKEDER